MNHHEHHHDQSSEDLARFHPEATQHHHEHGPIVDRVHTVDVHGNVATNKSGTRGRIATVGDEFEIEGFSSAPSFNDFLEAIRRNEENNQKRKKNKASHV